jgi:ribulose-phosphate 3-epimerase
MPALSDLHQLLPTVSVGMLAADLGALRSEANRLERAGVKMLHFDIMDGCFTPMLTFGAPVVAAVETTLWKDVHLMIVDPLDKVDAFVAAGADLITIHVESCTHVHRVLQRLGTHAQRRVARGIALNPGTPLETVEPLLDEIEYILLLAVNPGWGGQKMIGSIHRRVPAVLELVRKSGRDILLGVDGGLDRTNIAQFAEMGVDVLVSGSAVFAGDVEANARHMLREVAEARPVAKPC